MLPRRRLNRTYQRRILLSFCFFRPQKEEYVEGGTEYATQYALGRSWNRTFVNAAQHEICHRTQHENE